jgi:hypothetical protein
MSQNRKRLLLALEFVTALALFLALIKYASLPKIGHAFQAANKSLLLLGTATILS